MIRLGIALVIAGLLGASAMVASAAVPQTGRFSFEDQFVVQPDDPASCSFPVAFDLQVHGTFVVLFDGSGQPVRVLLHEHWAGTGSANGKQVIEHAAQTDLIDLVSGDSANVGQIHDQTLSGGVVIHDVGLLRFDPDGNVTFEAGPHQGLNGDVAGLCSALAP